MMTGVVNGNQVTEQVMLIEAFMVEIPILMVLLSRILNLGLSILHLLENKESALAKVYKMLKPGGIFVTSTTCMGDAYSWFKLIAPIGRALGFFPLVRIFTAQHLIESLTDAGFALDYQWQPSKDKAIFIVAKKSG